MCVLASFRGGQLGSAKPYGLGTCGDPGSSVPSDPVLQDHDDGALLPTAYAASTGTCAALTLWQLRLRLRLDWIRRWMRMHHLAEAATGHTGTKRHRRLHAVCLSVSCPTVERGWLQ